MPHDIVFIHGMFMNPRSWAGWVQWFTERGYRCHAPPWPGHDGEPAALRAAPPDVLATLTLRDVVASQRAFVASLPAKPILIGHSMGGLVAQRLLNDDQAIAAVAIDPAPPRGIFTLSWSFLKSNLPIVNPFAGNRPVQLTLKRFHYAFCNTITLEATRPIHDAYVVPESRNVARGATGPDAAIDFARPHAPLLILGGERDHIVPWRLNEKNFKAYRHPGSTRQFQRLAGRDHYLCGHPDWPEVAELVEQWLRRTLGRQLAGGDGDQSLAASAAPGATST